MITCGAKLGYTGPKQLLLSKSHFSASRAPEVLANDLEKQMEAYRITRICGTPQKPFISSPLGLVPKANGGRRRIHDLSYSRHSNKSLNPYIPEEWGTLEYTTCDEAMAALITQRRGAKLVKRDLADAFRHMPVAISDWWLLGFFWDGVYYFDRFLPFGLRTSPYLFDLLAKALHWMLLALFHWSTAPLS